MKKSKYFVIMIITTIILLLNVTSVVSAQISQVEEVNISYYRIPWGTGTDEDMDGIIDNFGEAGVEYGNITGNFSHSLVDDWFVNWTFPTTEILNRPREGVKIAGFYEELWEIESSQNESVSPTTNCFIKYTPLPNFGEYEVITDVLNAVTFYVKLSAGAVMTGVQEFWYRSPVAWDETQYQYHSGTIPAHYLNIYNEDDELVFADQPTVSYGLATDDSVEGTAYKRVYYKVRMPFESDHKYRFEEYIKIIDDNPINSIKLFMARTQDIADDGFKETYIFRNSSYSRKLPVEASWGMLCTMGKGIAGTENVIFSGEALGGSNPVIYPQWSGEGSVNNVAAITVIIPMRTTTPVDLEISGFVDCVDGTGTEVFGPIAFEGLTGTAILTFNITDPNAATKSRYRFKIEITNFLDGEGDAMTYMMYPGNSWHILTAANSINGQQDWIDYAVYYEILEHGAAQDEESKGVNEVAFCIGLASILAGFIIIAAVLSAPVSIPLMVAGVIIGSAYVIGGGALLDFSLTGLALEKFPGWLLENLPRAAKLIWEGIKNLGKGLLDIVIRVVETIVYLGGLALQHAGAILAAIVDIIYFITAFAVWWLTAKFLSIMTSIRRGDIEKAGRTIVQVESVARRRIRQVTRPVKRTSKKVVRYVKGGK